jgi:hypothetical protein
VYRSTTSIYQQHCSINASTATHSPDAKILGAPPQLFESPLTFSSNHLENDENNQAPNASVAGDVKSSSEKCKSDSSSKTSSLSDENVAEAVRLRCDFDQAEAKRRRLDSLKD